MAIIEGSVGRNGSNGWRYYIEWSESNINVANNTSDVTATVKLYDGYARVQRSASATHTITIDGTNYSFTTGAYTLVKGDTLTIATATKTITHNSDGTKSITISASSPDLAQGSGYGPYSGSASGTVTLATIPRTSSVTCADGNIGSSTTININRASPNFTHTLTYTFKTITGTIATKTANTSIGWNIPTSFFDVIPNAMNGKGTITCQTYSGDTLIGTSNCNFNAFVINANPTVTADIKDVNQTTLALTGNASKLVKYFSNAQVTIKATPQKSATISSQKVVCGSKSATTVTSTINAIETPIFTVSCVDSRGLTASSKITQPSVDYVKLAFTKINIMRESTTSNTVTVELKGNYFNNTFGNVTNTLTLKWRYRLTNGGWSSYTTITPTISGNTFTYSGTLGTAFDYSKEYVFEFHAQDKLMTIAPTKNLTRGLPIIDIGQGDVDVNGDIKSNGFCLFKSVKANLTSAGYYAVCKGVSLASGKTHLIAINTSYSYSINSSLLFAISACHTTSKVNIAQIAGSVDQNIVSKIRVRQATSTATGDYYIDIYYNVNVENIVQAIILNPATMSVGKDMSTVDFEPVTTNSYVVAEYVVGIGIKATVQVTDNGGTLTGNFLKNGNIIIFQASFTLPANYFENMMLDIPKSMQPPDLSSNINYYVLKANNGNVDAYTNVIRYKNSFWCMTRNLSSEEVTGGFELVYFI